VFLDVDDEIGAQRIRDNKRVTDNYSSEEEVLVKTKERSQDNRIRWQKLYGVDIADMSNFDLIVDTTKTLPQEVADEIIMAFNQHKK